jgi:hypothetical protein
MCMHAFISYKYFSLSVIILYIFQTSTFVLMALFTYYRLLFNVLNVRHLSSPESFPYVIILEIDILSCSIDWSYLWQLNNQILKLLFDRIHYYQCYFSRQIWKSTILFINNEFHCNYYSPNWWDINCLANCLGYLPV